ncbi:MAG: diaminopimelate epimerase [Alphaproteobacteria bacterium]|jgi:diaminopimelate epimerase
MKTVPFIKMDGLGNDFVIIDNRNGYTSLTAQDVVRMGNRKTGVGFDQMILIEPSDKAFARMKIYNADGSFAGACGNGTRCVAKLLMDETEKTSLALEAPDGKILKAFRESPSALVTVNMGKPRLSWDEIPLAEETDTLSLNGIHDELPPPVAVSMGNPHAVFFVDDVENTDIARLGPQVENHPLFPQRTNVEFVQVIRPDLLRMRVWERGTGVTMACGTGACATLVAAVRRGLSTGKAEIRMDGGSLFVEWENNIDILMTGDTHCSFSGTAFL